MIKKTGIIIGIILVIAGLIVVDKAKMRKGEPAKQPLPSPTVTEEAGMTIDTERELWCKYKDKTRPGSGMIYLSGGRFRTDFTDENKTETHSAYDGNYYYVWGQNIPALKIATRLMIKDGATMSAKQLIETEMTSGNKTEMTCLGWAVDEKLIAVPTGVEFMDASARIQEIRDRIQP